MTWVVKLAGVESVITEKVKADSFTVIDGVVTFKRARERVLVVGVPRLISIKPEG